MSTTNNNMQMTWKMPIGSHPFSTLFPQPLTNMLMSTIFSISNHNNNLIWSEHIILMTMPRSQSFHLSIPPSCFSSIIFTIRQTTFAKTACTFTPPAPVLVNIELPRQFVTARKTVNRQYFHSDIQYHFGIATKQRVDPTTKSVYQMAELWLGLLPTSH